jgi:hypothetical protein
MPAPTHLWQLLSLKQQLQQLQAASSSHANTPSRIGGGLSVDTTAARLRLAAAEAECAAQRRIADGLRRELEALTDRLERRTQEAAAAEADLAANAATRSGEAAALRAELRRVEEQLRATAAAHAREVQSLQQRVDDAARRAELAEAAVVAGGGRSGGGGGGGSGGGGDGFFDAGASTPHTPGTPRGSVPASPQHQHGFFTPRSLGGSSAQSPSLHMQLQLQHMQQQQQLQQQLQQPSPSPRRRSLDPVVGARLLTAEEKLQRAIAHAKATVARRFWPRCWISEEEEEEKEQQLGLRGSRGPAGAAAGGGQD